MKRISTTKTLLLIAFLFVLTGCSVGATLKSVDNKLGEVFSDFQKDKQDDITHFMDRGSEMAKTARLLTEEQKEKINYWMSKNNLNEYGDVLETVYTGGTPLFDEATGVAKDRFEYLLEKFPSILDTIKDIDISEIKNNADKINK